MMITQNYQNKLDKLSNIVGEKSLREFRDEFNADLPDYMKISHQTVFNWLNGSVMSDRYKMPLEEMTADFPDDHVVKRVLEVFK